MYLFEYAVLGVHGRFPQLLGVHLTQTFVSLYFYVFLFAFAVLGYKAVALQVGPAILFYLVALALAFIQGRCGDV